LKNLQNILDSIVIKNTIGLTNFEIATIIFDSREAKINDVFVAIKGFYTDGHHYIDNAISNGAKAVICENIPENKNADVTYIQVEDSNEALSIMTKNYYDNPSEKINLIGITGTNGKTTIATLLYNLFTELGFSCGLISTVKTIIDKEVFAATHTTPNSMVLNFYLNKMVQKDVKFCFMEVSSHGIHQKRTNALSFNGGVFTNLTQDHLDYHHTFSAYRDVKKSFFNLLPKDAFALVNIDDKNGSIMLQNTKATKYTYALKQVADFKAKILESGFEGSLLTINNKEVWTRLIGKFNAYNLLAIYGVATILGINQSDILIALSNLKSVDGRFQYFTSKNKITVIIDYAHTPDALKNVLETINLIKKGKENIITVVGCGGDRDKGKRPKMANIAVKLSNQVILTSDNPRSENPETIIDEMEMGVAKEDVKKVLTIVNRKQAIKTACIMGQPNDIILIAGKGHENYQEIKGKRYDFNDLKITQEILNNLEN